MQLSFGDAEYNGKRTRREVFLAEMDQVVPWKDLLPLIEPHYPTSGQPGRQPYRLEMMLRIHFLQQWYALSDPSAEEALYDTVSMRRFAKIGGLDEVPDETTILNFRHLLEQHDLARKLFNRVNVADITQAHKLLHGKEDTVCGDSGYTGLEKREEMKRKRTLRYLIAEKPSKLKQIKNKRELKLAKRWEHTKASMRAKVEHPFRVIKRQFGCVKVRYLDLAKDTAQMLTLFALSNLWLTRKELMPAAGKVCL
ncbi:IS5 family transposase [Xanthomonas oryzae pv. oryzae]|uniref:transposase n=1 Tax=Xanthomonas oryzae TaxID=347 RepID=UPI000C7C5EBC|nr:transposase [Xanthomonas oryzae]AUJ14574.1 IS5 family transposase [Xanthomonas oryzae pv. oryzae]